MNYSNAYLYELQVRHRKAVFCDIERHFVAINTPQAEKAMSLLSHVPFDESLVFDCALNEIGQYDLTVGTADDEMEMAPFFTLSTGVTARVTIYAPTPVNTKTQFYKELVEHMFHMPANEDLVRWWSESTQLPSRITYEFAEDDDALCDVVIDLCTAASQVNTDPWVDF